MKLIAGKETKLEQELRRAAYLQLILFFFYIKVHHHIFSFNITKKVYPNLRLVVYVKVPGHVNILVTFINNGRRIANQ